MLSSFCSSMLSNQLGRTSLKWTILCRLRRIQLRTCCGRRYNQLLPQLHTMTVSAFTRPRMLSWHHRACVQARLTCAHVQRVVMTTNDAAALSSCDMTSLFFWCTSLWNMTVCAYKWGEMEHYYWKVCAKTHPWLNNAAFIQICWVFRDLVAHCKLCRATNLFPNLRRKAGRDGGLVQQI